MNKFLKWYNYEEQTIILVYNNYDDLFCYENSTNDKNLNQNKDD